MIDKKSFKKAVAMPLEGAGFVKRGQSWYLDGQDTIVVVNLQKSDWGEEYFVNIGIWLRALGDDRFPKENHCHLRFEPQMQFPDSRELIMESCSLDKGNDELLERLAGFLRECLIPFLRECSDLTKLKGLMRQGSFRGAAITADARRFMFGNEGAT